MDGPRFVSALSLLGFWHEFVTDAANREQVNWLGRISLYILSQSHDEIVDRPRVRVLV